MRVGTYGSAGPDGASARPSRGDCSLVCNRIATSRSSSSIGGKAIGAVDDDDSEVSAVDMRGGADRYDDDDDDDDDATMTHRRRPECDGDETKASVATASIRAM